MLDWPESIYWPSTAILDFYVAECLLISFHCCFCCIALSLYNDIPAYHVCFTRLLSFMFGERLTPWALSCIWRKAVHSTVQLLLVVSDQRSCHFHAWPPHCVNSKCTRFHLCSHDVKVSGGQAYCLHTAIYKQLKATAH